MHWGDLSGEEVHKRVDVSIRMADLCISINLCKVMPL